MNRCGEHAAQGCLAAMAQHRQGHVSGVRRAATVRCYQMAQVCNGSMSYDGVLCHRCRNILDESQQSDQEQILWYHTLTGLESCASLGCRLCDATRLSLEFGESQHGPYKQSLYTWDATLAMACTKKGLRVYRPVADPRPEPNWVPSSWRERYDPIADNAMHIVDMHGKLLRHHIQRISGFRTDTEDTFEQIRKWISCCSRHKRCQQWSESIGSMPSFLPTRLLELIEHEGQQVVKLKSADAIRDAKVEIRYATLSHCWGDRSVCEPFLLRRASLSGYETGIECRLLPRTFREAVFVTRKLGLRYLWIDALCIMQDDEHEWRAEAGIMAAVYSHGLVNIAATSAENSSGALFYDRDPGLTKSMIVPRYPPVEELNHLICGQDAKLSIADEPLGRRAWIVQERFLASRVVHFSKRGVWWECLETVTFEGYPEEISLYSSPNRGLYKPWQPGEANRDSEFERTWREMVDTYSQCQLTYSSDRPVAIIGMARAFSKLIGWPEEDYVHGTWRKWLERDMIWHVEPGADRKPTNNRVVPSWSRLSIDVKAISPLAYLSISTFDVLDVRRDMGPFNSAVTLLTVEAPLCLVTIEQIDESEPEVTLLTDDGPMRLSAACPGVRILLDDRLGLESSLRQPMAAYLMLGSARHSTRHDMTSSLLDGDDFKFLLLHYDPSTGHFERFGYVDMETGQTQRQDEHIRQAFLRASVPTSICKPQTQQELYTFTIA